MKHPKSLTLLLAAVLLLSLCACGSAPEGAPSLTTVPSGTPAAAPVPTPVPSTAAEPTPEPAPTATPEPSSEPAPVTETIPESAVPAAQHPAAEPTTEIKPVAEPASDPKSTALGFVGSDVSALYAAVGYPISSSYAPSCLGDGEDGELVYDGFTVYTFKATSGGETVSVVL